MNPFTCTYFGLRILFHLSHASWSVKCLQSSIRTYSPGPFLSKIISKIEQCFDSQLHGSVESEFTEEWIRYPSSRRYSFRRLIGPPCVTIKIEDPVPRKGSIISLQKPATRLRVLSLDWSISSASIRIYLNPMNVSPLRPEISLTFCARFFLTFILSRKAPPAICLNCGYRLIRLKVGMRKAFNYLSTRLLVNLSV